MRIIRENDESNIKTTNLTRKEFDKLLKQIADNTYCYSSLELTTDFLYHSLHADNDKLIKLLSDALKQNSYIKKLSLVNQNITNDGAIALAEVDTLEEIKLEHNCILFSGFMALVQNDIKVLSLKEDNHVFGYSSSEDLLKMTKILSQNQTLTELILSGTKIANHYLTEIFANNTSIKILDLSYNHPYVEGLRPLEHNKTLQHLDLSRCNLIDEAAEIIAKNSGLHTLIIDESNITDIGGSS
jgi:signal-transduction protein with cAMP-binding, CBS, and nucleotidyltransferase domain